MVAEFSSAKRRIAEAISFVTNPGLVIVAALGIISFRYAQDTEHFWHWWVIGSLLLLGPSLLLSTYNWFKDGKVDIDISNRQDRILPLLLVTLGAVMGSFLIFKRVANPNMLLLSYTLASMLIALTIITSVWKISLHITTLTALSTLLVLFGGSIFAWFYLAIIPVGWARLSLKQHTLAQVIGGVLVGAGVTTAVFLILR